MAKFKITEVTDWKLTHGTRGAKIIGQRPAIALITISIFVGIALALKQYVFAYLVVSVVLIFSFLMRFALKETVRMPHVINKFWAGKIQVKFSERVFYVTVGLNKFTLAVADLTSISERDGHYYLVHDSGITLLIPKSSLSLEELKQMQNYKKQIEKRDREFKYHRSRFKLHLNKC